MILMHGDKPAAEIEMNGNILAGYRHIYDKKELPIGTIGNSKEQEHILINHWVKSRLIPGLRPNIPEIEKILGISKTDAFIQSAGISLTDTYWIKAPSSEIKWEQVNFHRNGFSNPFAEYYFYHKTSFSPSPDFTTDGIMEKFWLCISGQPYLFKLDRKYDNALCANEVVYAKIASDIGCITTPYLFGEADFGKYCLCPCFVNVDSCDYINAMQVKHSDFSKTGESLVRYFMNKLGFEKEMRAMISLDCLFHNTDRHERNFGYLKFSNGELKFVPPFDNGYCLGVNREVSHPITDGDMKLFSGNRKDIIECYGTPLDLDKKYCFNILETVYQEYGIPEWRFDMAKQELTYGIDLLKQKQYAIPFEEECER